METQGGIPAKLTNLTLAIRMCARRANGPNVRTGQGAAAGGGTCGGAAPPDGPQDRPFGEAQDRHHALPAGACGGSPSFRVGQKKSYIATGNWVHFGGSSAAAERRRGGEAAGRRGGGRQGGEAMGDVDFKDLKTVPEKVAETVAMAASSGAHLAGLLKGAGYPGVATAG